MAHERDWEEGFTTSIDDDTDCVKLSFHGDEPQEVLLDIQAIGDLLTELMYLKKQLTR